jgi:PucR family transcriptional regulator, purine catabolism regulatory protein
LWALRYARVRQRALVEFAALERSATWLPADPRALAGIVHEILGPLSTYDASHGTELLHSLQTLLEHERNVTATAHALGVHRNTVLHRIAQVEQLTGRDLRRIHDLSELWLAISASELLGHGSRRAPYRTPREPVDSSRT